MFSLKRNQRKSADDLRSRRSLDAIRALGHARSSEQIVRSPQLQNTHHNHQQQHPPLPDNDRLAAATAANSNSNSNSPSTFSPPPRPSSSRSPRPPTSPADGSTKTSSSMDKRHSKFGLLRLRNASDSAIGLKVRDPDPPPVPTPPPPAIITTAPTNDVSSPVSAMSALTPKRSGTIRLWSRRSNNSEETARPSPPSSTVSQRSSLSNKRLRGASSRNNSSMRLSRVTFDEPERPQSTVNSHTTEPPPYEEQSATLPIPPPRLSESSRSTASSGDQTIACSTTTTTHTTTTTTFFRLRRKKKENHLFPLPPRVTHEDRKGGLPEPDMSQEQRRMSTISTRSTPASPSPQEGFETRPVSTVLAASAIGLSGPGAPMFRSNSLTSVRDSGQESPGSPARRQSVFRRARSSTMGSVDQNGDSRNNSGRNSMALGGLLDRIMRDSDPNNLTRTSSPRPGGSAATSRGVSQEIFIPERNDEDTPPMYLAKLLQAVSKSVAASLLARNGDQFHQAVLKSYMETFEFEAHPMDMSLRRLLMEVELPSETQQIDRVLQAFSERYHECNPFIYQDVDQAYYVAFSLIMLHTDFFNPNNKHKMQKNDYIKNTSSVLSTEGISADILECFYSNIVYTPFIRVEDEFDINGEKILPHRPRRGLFHRSTNLYDSKRVLKEPVDPYALLIDGQLDLLRPSLKHVLQLEDPYSYSGTASRLDMSALHRAFFRSGVLQITSARSRPDAFMTQATVENPDAAEQGVVDMKVTKIGILWRKELKKKKARSPWHEWGAILTGSQLYFFRNLTWIKNLMSQFEQHHKYYPDTPVILTPRLPEFKPDALISTDDAVALLDKSYKKHKNAFAFVRHGNIQEYLIADSESEMNDWLAKLNYAATFRTAGVRMRGVVGGNYDAQKSRAIRRMDSIGGSSGSGSPRAGIHSVQTPSGEVSIIRGGIDAKLAAEIATARREVVERRVIENEDKIATANKQLMTHLRNARHLTILTPIQPRTRDGVLTAAATLAAKLQWIRMEMWKLRCHRDILALDLEEERLTAREYTKRNLTLTTPQATARISPIPSANASPITQQEGTQPLAVSPSPSQRSNIDRSTSRESVTSVLPPRSPSASSLMRQRQEILARDDDRSVDTHSMQSPTPTAHSESEVGSEPLDDIKPASSKDELKAKPSKGKDKDSSSRQHIRRSLQRTLRETQGQLGHKRAKSSDEGNTSASTDGKVEGKKAPGEEGLARDSTSFTVHGKKASIVTFGKEWQNMNPEERLRKIRTGNTVDSVDDAQWDRGDRESMQSFLTATWGETPMQGMSRRASQTTGAGAGSKMEMGVREEKEKEREDAWSMSDSNLLGEKLVAKLNGVKEKEGEEVSREVQAVL